MSYDHNVTAADRYFDEDEYAEALMDVTEKYIDAGLSIKTVTGVLSMLHGVHEKNSTLGIEWQEESVSSALDTLKKGLEESTSKYRTEFDCLRLERLNEKMTNYRQWCNSARVVIGQMKKYMWEGDHKKAGEFQLVLISMLDDEIDPQ